MRGLIYQNPFLYNIAVRLVYGKNFEKHYRFVADNIKGNWSVLDLCCGDCHLKSFLNKTVKYEGRDFNDVFIRHAGTKGINVSYCDLRKPLQEQKKVDCVIMMGSLHQFMPEEDRVINDMKRIASKRVIINEPVKNVVSSENKWVSVLAKIISNPDNEKISNIKRFSRDDVVGIFKRHGVTRIIDGGKDLIGIFDLCKTE